MSATSLRVICLPRIANNRRGELLRNDLQIIEMTSKSTVATLLVMLVFAHSAPIPEDCEEHWATQRLDHFRWDAVVAVAAFPNVLAIPG